MVGVAVVKEVVRGRGNIRSHTRTRTHIRTHAHTHTHIDLGYIHRHTDTHRGLCVVGVTVLKEGVNGGGEI